MNNNICDYNPRNSFTMTIVFSFMLFVMTGCCCCPDMVSTKREAKAGTDQLAAMKKEDITVQKTGMLFSFADEAGVKQQKAMAVVPVGGYKDLSIHYNLPEEGKCPFGVQDAHTAITAGPNMNFKSSGTDVLPNGKHSPGIGFQVGFQTVYRLSDNFSVVPGLLFKQNNAKETGEVTEGGEPPYNESYKIEDKYSFNYLSAPILAQYNLTDNLSLSAGPEINYLLSAKVNSTRSFGGEDQKEKINISDDCVRVGVGVQAGVKYDFPDSRWSMELMYDHRLSRLNKKPDDYPYPTPAWRMKSVQLSAKCRICDLIKGPKHQNTKK